MQIDILSSNTLKLTLSRLDMFDLDIKYESLSGKNPETKRLLAHVLKSIRLDQLNQKTGFDFSSDRIFVEAFPRPDGGCMLYVSSLGDENNLMTDNTKKRKTSAKSAVIEERSVTAFKAVTAPKAVAIKRENLKSQLIFETDGVRELSGLCRSLCLQKEWKKQGFENLESTLYMSETNDGKYRLLIKGEGSKNSLLTGIAKEYGDILRGEREMMFTKEHFKPIIENNAAERLNELL
jgi:negative regulator of genetic competence, sporulation and motility